MPTGVIRLFSRELPVSPRELLGTLLRFEELVRQKQTTPEIALARAFLRHEIQADPIQPDAIIRSIAREFGLRVADIKSASRDQSLSLARQSAMFLIRELCGTHFAEIGAMFGNRRHTTVLHSCSKIREAVTSDVTLRKRLNRVRQSLHGTATSDVDL